MNLHTKQGPYNANLWFTDPHNKKSIIFEIFQNNFFCLKGIDPDYTVSKNYANRLRNEVMAAKNVKF